AQDYFVDVGVREFLWFDLVFLGCAQKIVEEGDIELEYFNELYQPAVGDVQLAVEVEGPRIAIGAELGDLAIIDVAGQLRRVLVLLVLGLEGTDADAVLFREDQAENFDLVDHAAPVAVVLGQKIVVHVAAERTQLALNGHLVIVILTPLVEARQNVWTQLER